MTYNLDELKDMVPIYVNGRLSESDAEAFEAGLRQYPELEAELNDFSAIKESYAAMPAPPKIDSDALFARIQEGIRSDTERAAEPRQESPVAQLLQFFKRIYHMPSLSWSMAGLQFAALLLVFFLVPQQPLFQTLTSAPGSEADKVRLNVVFDKDAKEVEIRTLLQRLGAVIADGPSAEGLYVLAVDKSADIDRLLRELNASPIVRLAAKVLSRMGHTPPEQASHGWWPEPPTPSCRA